MNVAAHEDKQKRADESVKCRIKRSFAQTVHDTVIDNDWQVDHSEVSPKNRHDEQ